MYPAFFPKEKQGIWKAVNKKTEFVDLFASLGDEVVPRGGLVHGLENFVSFLHGHLHLLSVNEVWQKFSGKSSIRMRRSWTLA